MRNLWGIFGLVWAVCGVGSFTEAQADDDIELQTQIAPALLDAIVLPDNRVGIRDEEVPTYFEMLKKTASVKLSMQKQAAKRFQETRRKFYPVLEKNPQAKFPTFRDVFLHPDAYKGKLITLRGHTQLARQFTVTEQQKADYGFETLYELWVYTEDSQNNPMVVICSEIPDEFPLGNKRADKVTITGYFFKMYGYRAEDTTRLAPMVVGHKLLWKPAEEAKSFSMPVWGYGVIAAVVFCAAGFLWLMSQKDRSLARQRQSLVAAEEPLFPTVTDEFEGLLQSPAEEQDESESPADTLPEPDTDEFHSL